jgi:hypothetical protein
MAVAVTAVAAATVVAEVTAVAAATVVAEVTAVAAATAVAVVTADTTDIRREEEVVAPRRRIDTHDCAGPAQLWPARRRGRE